MAERAEFDVFTNNHRLPKKVPEVKGLGGPPHFKPQNKPYISHNGF